MIKFLDGDEINAKLQQTIKEADDYLLLISPYIKLSSKLRSQLQRLVSEKPQVEIEVVFGKNKDNPAASLNAADLDFLKTLPNIRIGYVEELHAKIYCSEDRLMLTSLNLHEYSQVNNFEAAFVLEGKKSLIGMFTDGAAKTAWEDALRFAEQIIAGAKCIFKSGKTYKPVFFNLFEVEDKEIREDYSKEFFRKKKAKEPDTNGYCIRTGKPITFNIKRPFSDEAYKSWARFSNKDFKEKYCHYSGEVSNGETSFASPVLRKNWRAFTIKTI